jgi:hypothetical protein
LQIPSPRNSMQFPWFQGVCLWLKFCIFCRSWTIVFALGGLEWDSRRTTPPNGCDWAQQRQPLRALAGDHQLGLLLPTPTWSCCSYRGPHPQAAAASHHSDLLLLGTTPICYCLQGLASPPSIIAKKMFTILFECFLHWRKHICMKDGNLFHSAKLLVCPVVAMQLMDEDMVWSS